MFIEDFYWKSAKRIHLRDIRWKFDGEWKFLLDLTIWMMIAVFQGNGIVLVVNVELKSCRIERWRVLTIKDGYCPVLGRNCGCSGLGHGLVQTVLLKGIGVDFLWVLMDWQVLSYELKVDIDAKWGISVSTIFCSLLIWGYWTGDSLHLGSLTLFHSECKFNFRWWYKFFTRFFRWLTVVLCARARAFRNYIDRLVDHFWDTVNWGEPLKNACFFNISLRWYYLRKLIFWI